MDEIHNKIIENFTNKDNPIILDIGCFLGEDGDVFAQLFPNGRVYEFEADPRVIYSYKQLEHPSNVQLVETAIHSYDGESTWYQSQDIDFNKQWFLSNSTRAPKEHLKEYTVRFNPKSIQVPCQRLDTWYDNELKDKEIQLLWADLNGGEMDMIYGGEKTLKNTKLLWIECFEKEMYEGQVHADFVKKTLNALGFDFLWSFGHNYLYERN